MPFVELLNAVLNLGGVALLAASLRRLGEVRDAADRLEAMLALHRGSGAGDRGGHGA